MAFPWCEFIPKSYLCLKRYSPALFRKDLISGITVGIIALPLAMAFAIASGLPPERGLFTAIVAGFLISALGGSRTQIGGPTGAFVVIVFDIVARNGYEGLAISTLLAGLLLIGMGLCRFGSWIKYIPYPLVTGFTTGIALVIFSSQIKDLLGLSIARVPADFVPKWAAYAGALPDANGTACAMGLGTLALILAIRRFCPRIPWGIGAIAIATIVSTVAGLHIDTIETRFGDLPRTLPIPSLPALAIPAGKLQEYLFDALAIAVLAGIESLLSAVVADGMTGGRHKSNCELVGQGIANCASILFGGLPATGAIARTAANIKTGAETPVSGMIHAITLLALLAVCSPLVAKVPLASLAAVLVMVAWNMSELHAFFHYLKTSKSDASILLTAFLLTVFVDITFAIVLGTILASFLFMKRMSETFRIQAAIPSLPECQEEGMGCRSESPREIEIFEVRGPFFFATADMLKDLLANFSKPPKVFVLQLQHVPFIDSSGAEALREFHKRCAKAGIKLLLADVHGGLEKDLKRFNLISAIGETHIFTRSADALLRAGALAKSSS